MRQAASWTFTVTFLLARARPSGTPAKAGVQDVSFACASNARLHGKDEQILKRPCPPLSCLGSHEEAGYNMSMVMIMVIY